MVGEDRGREREVVAPRPARMLPSFPSTGYSHSRCAAPAMFPLLLLPILPLAHVHWAGPPFTPIPFHFNVPKDSEVPVPQTPTGPLHLHCTSAPQGPDPSPTPIFIFYFDQILDHKTRTYLRKLCELFHENSYSFNSLSTEVEI